MKFPMICACLALCCGFAPPTFSSENLDAAWDDIDAIFAKFAEQEHVPGLIVGVVRGGELVKASGFGVQDLESGTPVSQDTVFRIASLTKSFTALAILNLRDARKLNLDAAATSLVPELNFIPQAGAEAGPIRLRELLTHSAGLVTDDPWGDRQLDMSEARFTRFMSQGIPLARAPGEVFEYSNTGYAILGRVISNTSNLRFQEYIDQNLIHPLRMKSTFWEVRDVPAQHRAVGYAWVDDHHEVQPQLPDGAFGAMAGLSTSAADYGRFVAGLLSAWGEKPEHLAGSVKPATVREAGRGVIFSQLGQREAAQNGTTCPIVWMYGAGFYVVQDCELGLMLRHPGGLPGYGAQVLLLPHANVGIFAFANLTYAQLSGPVVEAALRLKRAGLLDRAGMQISEDLKRAAASALQIFEAGDVDIAREVLAGNLLLDRSAARRNADLRRYREAAGKCSSIDSEEILNAHAGRFTLVCEKVSLKVAILLSPTMPPRIQYLDFELTPEIPSH